MVHSLSQVRSQTKGHLFQEVFQTALSIGAVSTPMLRPPEITKRVPLLSVSPNLWLYEDTDYAILLCPGLK